MFYFIDTVLLQFFLSKVLLSIIFSHSSLNKLAAAFFLYSHLQLLRFQNKLFVTFSTNQTLTSTSIFVPFFFIIPLQTFGSNLNSHLQPSCHFICFVLFYHYIRSNNFTVMLLIISGIHTLEYGLLILLQFPLLLLLLYILDFLTKHILKNLKLRIKILHQLFFYKPKHFILCHSFSLNKHKYLVFRSLKILHIQY